MVGWWVGWLVDIPGVNAQEKTREELIESLRFGVEDMLETECEENFDKEVELHRSSKELMDILDERSKNKGTKTSISEMRKEFGLEKQSKQRPQS